MPTISMFYGVLIRMFFRDIECVGWVAAQRKPSAVPVPPGFGNTFNPAYVPGMRKTHLNKLPRVKGPETAIGGKLVGPHGQARHPAQYRSTLLRGLTMKGFA